MKRAFSILIILMLAVVFMPLWGYAQKATPPAAAPETAKPAEHQHGGKDHEGHHHGEAGGAHHGMMEKCKEMMGKHDQAKADIAAMDARLDEKLAALNAAKGDDRVAAMAAVINELVAQRKEMHAKFGDMHHGKMCNMMCDMMSGKGGHGGGKMGGKMGRKGGHGGMGGMSGDCGMMQHHGGEKQQQGT